MHGVEMQVTCDSLLDNLQLTISALIRTRAAGTAALPALPHEPFYGTDVGKKNECENVSTEMLIQANAARDRLVSLLSAETIVSLDSVKCVMAASQQALMKVDPGILLDIAFVNTCIKTEGNKLALREVFDVLPPTEGDAQVTLEGAIAAIQALQVKTVHKYLPATSQAHIGQVLDMLQRLQRCIPLENFTFTGTFMQQVIDRLPRFIRARSDPDDPKSKFVVGTEALTLLFDQLVTKAGGDSTFSLEEVDHVRRWGHLLGPEQRKRVQQIRETTMAQHAQLAAALPVKANKKRKVVEKAVKGEPSASGKDSLVALASMFD